MIICVLKQILHKKKSISMQLTESPIPLLYCCCPTDDHLQESSPSRWSFARGRFLRIIICKSPAPPDHHLQEAVPSGSSFARGRALRMTICKRPVPRDHHLQEAGPLGSSFARGLPLILTTTKRAWKIFSWDPSQWDKMCFECQRIKFQWKKRSKFLHLPPPLGRGDFWLFLKFGIQKWFFFVCYTN